MNTLIRNCGVGPLGNVVTRPGGRAGLVKDRFAEISKTMVKVERQDDVASTGLIKHILTDNVRKAVGRADNAAGCDSPMFAYPLADGDLSMKPSPAKSCRLYPGTFPT